MRYNAEPLKLENSVLLGHSFKQTGFANIMECFIPSYIYEIFHKLRLRMQTYLVRRSGLLDSSLIRDDNTVRDFHRLLLVVRHKDTRDAYPVDHLL